MSQGTEWRVLTFHGSIHMATIPATDEADARRIAEESTYYRPVVQARDVTPWETR